MEWEFPLMAYVQKDGLNLQHVPFERRTYAICVAAVMQNPNALFYVPVHNDEIYRIAFDKAEPVDIIIPILPQITVVS